MANYLKSLSSMVHFFSLVKTVPNGKLKLGADFFYIDLKFTALHSLK